MNLFSLLSISPNSNIKMHLSCINHLNRREYELEQFEKTKYVMICCKSQSEDEEIKKKYKFQSYEIEIKMNCKIYQKSMEK